MPAAIPAEGVSSRSPRAALTVDQEASLCSAILSVTLEQGAFRLPKEVTNVGEKRSWQEHVAWQAELLEWA